MHARRGQLANNIMRQRVIIYGTLKEILKSHAATCRLSSRLSHVPNIADEIYTVFQNCVFKQMRQVKVAGSS